MIQIPTLHISELNPAIPDLNTSGAHQNGLPIGRRVPRSSKEHDAFFYKNLPLFSGFIYVKKVFRKGIEKNSHPYILVYHR